MSSGEVSITTTSYEGPLSLLLSLVRKRKLFINDISLAEVADDFLRAMNTDRTIAEDAEFVDVASTLLLLKSRSLLPNFFLTEEEEQAVTDLEERLQVYELVEKVRGVVAERWGQSIMFVRRAGEVEPVFLPDQAVSKANLRFAIEGVFSTLPQKQLPARVSVKQTVRLESVVERIRDHIKRHLSASFKDLARGAKSRGETVLFFVALLELVKEGVLEARQQDNDDIALEHAEITTPRYA